MLRVLLFSTLAGASMAEHVPPDARSLFLDPTSVVTIPASSGVAVRNRVAAATRKPAAQAPRTARNTGLMYWVELVRPGGELRRVTADYPFRGGDEIRLHLQSNVDGRLKIYQKQPDGTMEMLFPDRRVNGGDNLVRAGSDAVIPGAKATFAFDNRKGTERLIAILEPVSAAPSRLGEDAWKLDVAESRRVEARAESDSRSLFIKVDRESPQPASYAVNSSWDGNSETCGDLVITIDLVHR